MAAIFTANTEALADVLALAYESLDLTELNAFAAGRYRELAGDLVAKNLPRDMKAIAEVLAERIEDADLDQIAPWDFCRHLDVAEDVLAQF